MFDGNGVFMREVERGDWFGHEALLAPLSGGVAHWPYSLVAGSGVELLTIPVLTLLEAFDGDAIVQKMIDRARKVEPWKADAPKEGEEGGESPGELKVTDIDLPGAVVNVGPAKGGGEEGGESTAAPISRQGTSKVLPTGDVRLLKAKDKIKGSAPEKSVGAMGGGDSEVLKSHLSNHHNVVRGEKRGPPLLFTPKRSNNEDQQPAARLNDPPCPLLPCPAPNPNPALHTTPPSNALYSSRRPWRTATRC